jgi:hypothetical protein
MWPGVCRLMLFSLLTVSGNAQSGPLNISDSAVARLLNEPFQYDYTLITNDSTLRHLINAVDGQLALIECRRRAEYLGLTQPDNPDQDTRRRLEERYRTIIQDGMIFATFEKWRDITTDPVNRAFLTLFSNRRDEFIADPQSRLHARDLARRIADNLQRYRFKVGDSLYSAPQAAYLVAYGDDRTLARSLYRQQNDSAALMVKEATELYFLYSRMGEERGFVNSFSYNISQLSFRPAEWTRIVKELKTLTDSTYQSCLDTLRVRMRPAVPTLADIEQWLNDQATLPDSFFTAEKSEAALGSLLARMGIDSLFERVTRRTFDSGVFPAVAVRIDPPHHNVLITNRDGGFLYYRRLAAEAGRLLPWVFADSSLPRLERDYPSGAEESLTGLFASLATHRQFLATHFTIPDSTLHRFESYDRWLTIFRLRQLLLFYLLDYYLSEGGESSPRQTYWSLEYSLLGVRDSSYRWMETLIMGELSKYPGRVASQFLRLKLEEILRQRFGDGFAGDPQSGRFLIAAFCRPGRSLTMERFLAINARDRLAVMGLAAILMR